MFLSRPNEKLQTHIDLFINQYSNINNTKKIDTIVNNIINKLCKENNIIIGWEEIIKELFMEAFILHDEGKKNPYFQSYIQNIEYADYKYTQSNKHHAEISAIYYCIQMYKKYVSVLNNKKERLIQEYLKDIIISFAYNIYRHHSNLEDWNKDNFIDNLIHYYSDNKDLFINIDISNIEYLNRFQSRKKCEYKNAYTFYLLNKLNYSLLITCDFMAVYQHNTEECLKINNVDEKTKKHIDLTFNNSSVIKQINNFRNNPNLPLSNLNRNRSEMYLESELEIIKHKDSKNIFYLEAPTGCGKSLTGLNLVLNLLDEDINKVYYVAPFNNILEQTHKVIEECFYEDVVTVNSREDIFISDSKDQDIAEDNSINYDKDFLNSQMINYPVSLISHVRFFDILFSNNRFKNLMLSTLCNSVIIIDEIQSYKNVLWINIINTLKEFAEMLNLKIIIMSATLPKMNELLDDKDCIIPNLICNREYYYDYFKQRVDFNFDLFKKGKNSSEEVFNQIEKVIRNTDKHRILIECLTTARAEEFYQELKKYEGEGFLVFKMNGISNSYSRKYIIKTIQNKLKNNACKHDKIILIGTQCIEAGIDIDMQIGFKDISILDADEQFAGRIERNFNDTGIVYFFDIDDGDFIYKGDFRTEKNLKDDDWKRIFKDKNFNEFYKRNYKWLLEKKSDEYNKYKLNLGELNYASIQNNMKLIDSNTYSFLFMCQYEGKEKADLIFEEFLGLRKLDLKYTEKEIKKRHIKKELNNYIYSINTYNFKNDIGLRKIDNLYIVDDATEYFDNLKSGKLTSKSTLILGKFINQISLFL